MRYRKKPIVIEAFRLGHEEAPTWYMGTAVWIERFCHEEIETPEGTMRADKGDWIVRGIKGEQYPVKNDIFEATYEPA